MEDKEFDRALISAALRLAAECGWRGVSVAEAARRADLPLDRARARFPAKPMLLLRFGSLADQAALALAPREGPHRDRLFDILMRRIDVLQADREGVIALLRGLPADPCTAALLAAASVRSMRWMLEGAGIAGGGVRGRLRAKALLVVWLATVRAWERDTGEDLAATMAALDNALRRAEQVQGWVSRRGAGASEAPAGDVAAGDAPAFDAPAPAPEPPPFPEPPASPPD
jgi:ubiquinone biosynthesis protein COQ9